MWMIHGQSWHHDCTNITYCCCSSQVLCYPSNVELNSGSLWNLVINIIFSFSSCQEQISAIPGTAGRDYPNFDKPPRTSFTCEGLSPGYYSDPEGECQVYHRCTHGNAVPSFTRLCPVGNKNTTFSNMVVYFLAIKKNLYQDLLGITTMTFLN